MKTSVILSGFIKQEEENSLPKMLVVISTCNDMARLRRFTYSHNHSEIVKAAEKRLETEGQNILNSIDSIEDLAILFQKENFWNTHWHKPIVERVKTLCGNITTIEELFSIRKNIPHGSTECTMQVDYAIEECIIERVVRDERRLQFQFLLDTWKRLTVYSSKKIEPLLSDALEFEKDPKKLHEWHEKAFRGWDHNNHGMGAALRKRMNEVIERLLPIEGDPYMIKKYGQYTYSTKLMPLIDKRLAKIVRIMIARMDLDQLISYYEKLNFGYYDEKYPKTKKEINEQIGQVLPSALPSITSATAMYGYLKKLGYRIYHYQYGKPAVIRFKELLYADIESNNINLDKITEWYSDMHAAPSFKNILEEGVILLINKETEPSRLEQYINKFNKDVSSQIKNQIGSLVSKMKSANNWFKKCIKERTFFDQKDIFLKKAKEFSS
jgi:hypothetical protein